MFYAPQGNRISIRVVAVCHDAADLAQPLHSTGIDMRMHVRLTTL